MNQARPCDLDSKTSYATGRASLALAYPVWRIGGDRPSQEEGRWASCSVSEAGFLAEVCLPLLRAERMIGSLEG